MREYLVDRGVPEAAIVADPGGIDTYSSCAHAAEKLHVESVTIVSDDYHLPRAITLCRELGVDAYGVGETGLETAEPFTNVRGRIREYLAGVKMEWDLATHRTN